MKHDGSIRLFQYWNRIRMRRDAPLRSDIRPGDISQQLADTFILQSENHMPARFRLVGTRICAIFGSELKSHAFSTIWAERNRKLVANLTTSVMQQNMLAVMSVEGVSVSGRCASFETLMLPLTRVDNDQRIFGSFCAFDDLFWLGADPIEHCTITAVRMIASQNEAELLRESPAASMSDITANGYSVATPHSSSVPRLRVIEGGKKHSPRTN